MERGKTIILILSLMLIAGNALHAQSYGNALGVRLGNGDDFRSVGVTLQQRILKRVTTEGILQTNFSDNTTFHLLLEQHQPLVSRRLNYYVGAGISFGTEQFDYKNIPVSEQGPTLGADLIAGIEVTLLKYNISIDYKPNFNITGRESWYQGQVAVSARAVMMSGASYDKNRRQREKEKQKALRQKKRAKRDPFPRSLINKIQNL